MKKSISIVIPAYNEERRIGKTVRAISEYLKKNHLNYELIVVDDGSKDRTVEILKEVKKKFPLKIISNSKNMGKGYSVRRGVLASKKELVLFSDADLSTPINELKKFFNYLREFPIIIGSRRMKDSKIVVKQPFYRTIPGKVFPLLVNLFILRGIRDTQCGFKLFKREVARSLFKMQKLNGFSFDAEILYLAKKKGFKVKEVPVSWRNDADSKLNAITDSYRMFKELLKIKWNDIKGAYN